MHVGFRKRVYIRRYVLVLKIVNLTPLHSDSVSQRRFHILMNIFILIFIAFKHLNCIKQTIVHTHIDVYELYHTENSWLFTKLERNCSVPLHAHTFSLNTWLWHSSEVRLHYTCQSYARVMRSCTSGNGEIVFLPNNTDGNLNFWRYRSRERCWSCLQAASQWRP